MSFSIGMLRLFSPTYLEEKWLRLLVTNWEKKLMNSPSCWRKWQFLIEVQKSLPASRKKVQKKSGPRGNATQWERSSLPEVDQIKLETIRGEHMAKEIELSWLQLELAKCKEIGAIDACHQPIWSSTRGPVQKGMADFHHCSNYDSVVSTHRKSRMVIPTNFVLIFYKRNYCLWEIEYFGIYSRVFRYD